MAHWSSVWNGFKEQRPPNSFQRNSGAFAVDPIGPSASVLWRSGSVMISVICGGSPKFDAPQVRPAFQKKLQQERSSTIIKPSSHHQSEFVFFGICLCIFKAMLDFRHRVLVCQDHFQVFEEMETSSEPREEAGGFLAEPRQGLVPFKLKFIYPVICIGTC